MDVKLPNGNIIKGVPDGTSKDDVKMKAIAAGLATEADFGEENNVIPVGTGANTQLVDIAQQPAPQPELSVTDRLLGAVEAGAALVTGATTGTLGYIAGAGEGLARQALGQYTSEEAKQMAEQASAALTYAPRTQAGQEYTANIAEAASVLPPVVAGFTPQQIAGAGQAAKGSMAAARGLPEMLPQRQPEAMQGLSVGAAEIPMEQVRVNRANELPVPLGDKLTKGMRTQDFAQQKFEKEVAKDSELGGDVRQREIELNEGVLHNVDSFLDQTGTTITDKNWRSQTGNKVIDALSASYEADMNKVQNAYNAARAKGETQQVIDVSPLANYLNESRVDVGVAPVINYIAKEAERLGVARGNLEDGSFEILPMTIDQSETLRQRVGAFTDDKNKQDIRRAVQIKRLIDDAQDQGTGSVFQSARKQRVQVRKKFEDLAIIDKLLDTQGNYADQRIASEAVIDRAVIGGTVQDVKNLRTTLSKAGDAGRDALSEVRAGVVRYIRDEATSNVGVDPNGNPIVSFAKLNKAIDTLDEDGKLDMLFGKAEAEKWRILRDVARDIKVTQPNAVNNSNTASHIALAVDLALSSGFAIPLPIVTSLKAIKEGARKAKVKKKIEEALN